MRADLVNPEQVILEEIDMPEATRNDVALTYAFCLRQPQDNVDFGKINRAILARWSRNALRYIKERAWGIFEGRVEV